MAFRSLTLCEERRGAEDEDDGGDVFITFARCVIPTSPSLPWPPAARTYVARWSRCVAARRPTKNPSAFSAIRLHCVAAPFLSLRLTGSFHIGIPRNTFPFRPSGQELLSGTADGNRTRDSCRPEPKSESYRC